MKDLQEQLLICHQDSTQPANSLPPVAANPNSSCTSPISLCAKNPNPKTNQKTIKTVKTQQNTAYPHQKTPHPEKPSWQKLKYTQTHIHFHRNIQKKLVPGTSSIALYEKGTRPTRDD